jgi:hypothetical protein
MQYDRRRTRELCWCPNNDVSSMHVRADGLRISSVDISASSVPPSSFDLPIPLRGLELSCTASFTYTQACVEVCTPAIPSVPEVCTPAVPEVCTPRICTPGACVLGVCAPQVCTPQACTPAVPSVCTPATPAVPSVCTCSVPAFSISGRGKHRGHNDLAGLARRRSARPAL